MNSPKDKADAGRIFEKYKVRLRAFVGNRIGNREDADDILQDVFYQLFKTLDDGVYRIEHEAAWLFRVAANLIANKQKKKKEEHFSANGEGGSGDVLERLSPDVFGGMDLTPEDYYLRSLVWQELDAALCELPPAQRDVFELTELDGLSMAEISQMSGVSVNTLLSRKHYAVKHLRSRLVDLYREILEY